jgi:hypothetical protein
MRIQYLDLLGLLSLWGPRKARDLVDKLGYRGRRFSGEFRSKGLNKGIWEEVY